MMSKAKELRLRSCCMLSCKPTQHSPERLPVSQIETSTRTVSKYSIFRGGGGSFPEPRKRTHQSVKSQAANRSMQHADLELLAPAGKSVIWPHGGFACLSWGAVTGTSPRFGACRLATQFLTTPTSMPAKIGHVCAVTSFALTCSAGTGQRFVGLLPTYEVREPS